MSLGIKSPEKSPERLCVKNKPTYGLLKLLFSIWKEDFGTSVPVQLIFSKKNMGYLAEVKQREVKLIPMCGAGWHSCRSSASPQRSLVPRVTEASGVWSLLAALVSAGQWNTGMCTTCQGFVPAWGLLGRHSFVQEPLAKWPTWPRIWQGLDTRGWHWLPSCVFYQLAFLHACWCQKHPS